MRRVRAFGSTIGALVLASACATTTGNSTSSRYSATPSPQPTRAQSVAVLDSMRAQAVADAEGPGVSIRAEFETVAGSRRARAVFHLDDDAYVMVGHIDPEGIVRIVFPSDPGDDGFVKGDRSYSTAQFFAGFNEQYRYRNSTNGMYRNTTAAADSYDGGVGYVFIVAAWRPMRFDAFKDGAAWDTYQLASDEYLRDPRPAIQEFASLLVGDAREAYTLKFARYSSTQVLAGGGGGYGGFGFNSGFDYCAGYEPLGYSSPFFSSGFGGFGSPYQYGTSFSRRGTNYYYDQGSDCYRTGSPYGYGYGFGGYQIAQTPGVPITTGRRNFDVDHIRPPLEPKVTVGHTMPLPQASGPTVPTETPHISPAYRQRGLISTEEPATGPVRRQPQVQAQTPPDERSRPTLRQMLDRRVETANDGSAGGSNGTGRVRAPVNGDDRRYEQNGGAQNPRSRVQSAQKGNDGSNAQPRTYQRPEPSNNPRVAQPARSEPQGRSQGPERSAPPPRFEPPAARSAPPPSAPPPSPPPVKPPTA